MYVTAILLLRLHQDKTIIQKDTYTLMSVAALFTIAKTWERNNAICSNMVATRDYHTKRSKSERERQIPYDITYMWNLKYGTNETIYKIETDS